MVATIHRSACIDSFLILGQHQAFLDDLVSMIPSVGCVETVIDRQDVLLDVCLQFVVYHEDYLLISGSK